MNARTLIDLLVSGDAPSDSTGMRIVFERPLPEWAWLLVVVAAFLVALWSYRRLQGATKRLSRVLRGFLVMLRACAIVLLAVLIAGPSVRFERTRTEPDRLVVLVDRSRSLTIADAPAGPGGAATRDDQLRRILKDSEGVFAEIAGKTPDAGGDRRADVGKDIDWVGFSGGAFTLSADAIGKPEGERTDLDAALRQAVGRSAGRPLSGVLVLSDGRSSTPVSPETLRLLERDSVRVFAVALGSNERIGDAAIVATAVPARALP